MASVFDIKLITQLECPICKVYMKPPIRQCLNGHSFCEPCFTKIPVCLICKCEKGVSRNLILEHIICDLKFPCKYSEQGCAAILKGCDLKLHASECDYQDYPCPINYCEWAGTIQLFRKHYESDHPTLKKDLALNKINSTFTQQPRIQKAFAIFEAYDEVFIIKFICEEDFIGWDVVHFGSYKLKKKFAFEVNITNIIIMKAPCLPIKLYSRIKPQYGVITLSRLLYTFLLAGQRNYTIEIIAK